MPARPRPRSATRDRAAADPARDAWALVIQFFKAAKVSFLSEIGLTPAQAQLLLQLDPARPVPMNELANMLGCDASNVTGLVDRLESQQFIERRSASGDRRVKIIGVTTRGNALREKLLQRWYQPPAQIAALSVADKKTLLRLLRKAAVQKTE